MDFSILLSSIPELKKKSFTTFDVSFVWAHCFCVLTLDCGSVSAGRFFEFSEGWSGFSILGFMSWA